MDDIRALRERRYGKPARRTDEAKAREAKPGVGGASRKPPKVSQAGVGSERSSLVGDGPVAKSKYRDPAKRREYMRNLMRKRRAAKP